jgi:hypothetical protein
MIRLSLVIAHGLPGTRGPSLSQLGVWVPYASVTANANHDILYYHQLEDLNRTSKTQEEALSFGFIVARWVDEHLYRAKD